MATLNFTGVKTQSFDPLPNGRYEATVFDIEEQEVKNGKNAGAPMWAVQFSINGGPHDNRRVFRNFTLIPESLWALKNFLVALGIDSSALEGEVDIDTEDLIGLPCQIVVRQREYEGQIQNDVKQVMKSSGKVNEGPKAGKPADDDLPFV